LAFGVGHWQLGREATAHCDVSEPALRLLLIRGAWLTPLEITVVNFARTFSLAYPRWYLQVIWVIDVSRLRSPA
jgi:uncharacterized membrane protein